MNLQPAGTLIKKITSLFNNLDSDGTVTQIEKDLMRSYLRQLYEEFSDEKSPAEPINPVVRQPEPIAPPLPKQPEPVVYTPPPVVPVVVAPPPTPEPIVVAPIISYPPPPPEPTPVIQTPPVVIVNTPIVEIPASSFNGGSSGRSGFDQLFSQRKATELSEKLSETPISDLTRALSINDRLLYMNELFGRDMKALEEALAVLNKFHNLDAAKGYVITLAEQYNWSADEKTETANAFIRLVKRRYP
jgi:hypothetical protein